MQREPLQLNPSSHHLPSPPSSPPLAPNRCRNGEARVFFLSPGLSASVPPSPRQPLCRLTHPPPSSAFSHHHTTPHYTSQHLTNIGSFLRHFESMGTRVGQTDVTFSRERCLAAILQRAALLRTCASSSLFVSVNQGFFFVNKKKNHLLLFMIVVSSFVRSVVHIAKQSREAQSHCAESLHGSSLICRNQCLGLHLLAAAPPPPPLLPLAAAAAAAAQVLTRGDNLQLERKREVTQGCRNVLYHACPCFMLLFSSPSFKKLPTPLLRS